MDDFDRGYEFVALEGIGSLHGMDSAEWLNKVESSIRELYSAMVPMTITRQTRWLKGR